MKSINDYTCFSTFSSISTYTLQWHPTLQGSVHNQCDRMTIFELYMELILYVYTPWPPPLYIYPEYISV
jgi:hypothetical protein